MTLLILAISTYVLIGCITSFVLVIILGDPDKHWMSTPARCLVVIFTWPVSVPVLLRRHKNPRPAQ